MIQKTFHLHRITLLARGGWGQDDIGEVQTRHGQTMSESGSTGEGEEGGDFNEKEHGGLDRT